MINWKKGGTGGVEGALGVALKLAAGIALAVALVLPACGGGDDGGGESGCVSPNVKVNDQCQKKCDQATCAQPTMKCLTPEDGNYCTQPCKAHSDCPAGTLCNTAVVTADGTVGQFCRTASFGDGGGIGQYEPCASDADCDTYRAFKCIQKECRLTGCTSNFDCASVPGTCVKDPSGDVTKNYCMKTGTKLLGPFDKCAKSIECDTDLGLACVDSQCRFVGCHTHTDCAQWGTCEAGKDDTGKQVLACVKGKTYPAGQFGTLCPSGPGGTECDGTNKFVCLGAGEGDIDAYCTLSGCQADTDCALGYYCSTVRTSKKPCATACGITGSTGTDCVPADQIGTGKEYSCGPVSMLRNLCMKRDFCTTCQTDDDCRETPNQICAKDESGTKICTVQCNPDLSGSCPWGNAGQCGVYDTERNIPTCSHRFGKCKGAGGSCEPCEEETDCPNGLCLSGGFTGEKYCASLDSKCACTCTQDSDCLNGNKCVGKCQGSLTDCTADADCGSCLPKTGGTSPITCTAATATNCVNDTCDPKTCDKSSGNCGVSIEQDVYCMGGGCPKTPGGATMQCYGGSAVKGAQSPLYNKCVGADVNGPLSSSPQIGCWLPK